MTALIFSACNFLFSAFKNIMHSGHWLEKVMWHICNYWNITLIDNKQYESLKCACTVYIWASILYHQSTSATVFAQNYSVLTYMHVRPVYRCPKTKLECPLHKPWIHQGQKRPRKWYHMGGGCVTDWLRSLISFFVLFYDIINWLWIHVYLHTLE